MTEYPKPIKYLYTKGRQPYWLYECECGNTFVTRKYNVTSGKKTDCGCVKRPPLTGKKFGLLTVLNRADSRKWHCLCDCGNEVDVETNSLTRGKTKSCGCYRKHCAEQRSRDGEIKDREDAIYRRLYTAMKTRHINQLKFSADTLISFDKWKELTQKSCVYCGRDPFRERYDSKSDTVVKVNGLDRVDSSKGYTEDNVVPCCWDCNIAKSDMNLDEFIGLIERLSNNLGNIKQLSLKVCQ